MDKCRRLTLPFVALLSFAITSAAPGVALATRGRSSAPSGVAVIAGKPTEFEFKLSRGSVKLGEVTFKITDRGALSHDFKLCSSPKGGHANSCRGKMSKLLSPGKSTTMTYRFTKKGHYEYLCTVAGHAAAGMKGVLTVK